MGRWALWSGYELPGQQLEPPGALRRRRPPADRQQRPPERAIRPFVIGRKNWLFSDTPKGATASPKLYSLMETTKANNQQPYGYLRHILERLLQAVEDYDALLPWNCTPALPR